MATTPATGAIIAADTSSVCGDPLSTAPTSTRTTGISLADEASHTHTGNTDTIGSTTAFSILPSYYELAFLIKVAI
jgi:hypothetical protein